MLNLTTVLSRVQFEIKQIKSGDSTNGTFATRKILFDLIDEHLAGLHNDQAAQLVMSMQISVGNITDAQKAAEVMFGGLVLVELGAREMLFPVPHSVLLEGCRQLSIDI